MPRPPLHRITDWIGSAAVVNEHFEQFIYCLDYFCMFGADFWGGSDVKLAVSSTFVFALLPTQGILGREIRLVRGLAG